MVPVQCHNMYLDNPHWLNQYSLCVISALYRNAFLSTCAHFSFMSLELHWCISNWTESNSPFWVYIMYRNVYIHRIHAIAKLLLSHFSCVWLCDLIDRSPPGSPIPGILQARTLEWVGISFSNAWKWKVKVKSLSHVRLIATPWIVAYQASPSTGFSINNTGVGCHCLLC